MNAIVQLPNSATALDRIVEDIRRESTDMVLGAWRIGHLLLEAKGIIDDDTEFGRWRQEKLADLGLSRRTAQRMQNIATRFTDQDSLPVGLGLSALYDMSGTEVSDAVQQRTLDAVASYQQENGEAPSYRQVAQMLVEEKNAERRTFEREVPGAPANERVQAEARERAVAARDARQAAQEDAPEEQMVDQLLAHLARMRCATKRASAVSRLQAGLRRTGLVTVDEGIVACANVRTHRFEYTLEEQS